MTYKDSSSTDVCFLTLARPADTLTALVSSLLPHRRTTLTQCRSGYDLISALQDIPPEHLAILITRPSMLARPHLVTALRNYPNLRLIGWLGADEKPSDSAVSPLSGQVMVSSPEQLRCVIAGLRNPLVREPILQTLEVPAKPNTKIEPAGYRLSHEELDALLGAGK